MATIRPLRYRRLRRYVKRARLLRRRVPRMRMRYNPVPTFTETVALAPLTFNQTSTGNTTGLFQPQFLNIPQYTQYCSLYNQYCIRKCQLIFIPTYNMYDLNNPTSPTPVQAPRLVYAIQDSSLVNTPAVEDDVLQDNGAKIRMFTKPIKINFRPKACVGNSLNAGGFAATNRAGATWLTTQVASVPHNGVAFSFTTGLPPAGTPVLASVYMKLTFSLRDPK